MDSKHTCILRHEGDVMMFSRYCLLLLVYCGGRHRGKCFQTLLQPPEIQNVRLPRLLWHGSDSRPVGGTVASA